jgi:hypothetical protein
MPDQSHATGGRRFRRRRPATQTDVAGGETLLAAQAELTMLREENARLQSAQHQVPDVGAVLGRLRALPDAAAAGEAAAPAPASSAEDATDDAATLLLEGLVMRDALLQVCQELTQAVAQLEQRLRRLDVEHPEWHADGSHVSHEAA